MGSNLEGLGEELLRGEGKGTFTRTYIYIVDCFLEEMAQPRLTRIKKMLEELKSKKVLYDYKELIRAISYYIGSDKRTISVVSKDMNTFDLIEEMGDGQFRLK